MPGLIVYEKERLPFCISSFTLFPVMFWAGFTSFSVLLVFLYRPLSTSLYRLFDVVSSHIYRVLSINPSVNAFLFVACKVYHKWPKPIMVKLVSLVNSFIIFLSQTTLLRLLTFQLESLALNLTDLLFWSYFYLLSLQLLSLLSQFPLSFLQTPRRDTLFITELLYYISCWLEWFPWSKRYFTGGYL